MRGRRFHDYISPGQFDKQRTRNVQQKHDKDIDSRRNITPLLIRGAELLIKHVEPKPIEYKMHVPVLDIRVQRLVGGWSVASTSVTRPGEFDNEPTQEWVNLVVTETMHYGTALWIGERNAYNAELASGLHRLSEANVIKYGVQDISYDKIRNGFNALLRNTGEQL